MIIDKSTPTGFADLMPPVDDLDALTAQLDDVTAPFVTAMFADIKDILKTSK